MEANTQESERAGDVGSTRLLADAYRQAAVMRARFLDAVWSRGMTRKDHQQIAQLQTRMINLENTVYRAMQANVQAHAQPPERDVACDDDAQTS
jgi:hypothetical protein